MPPKHQILHLVDGDGEFCATSDADAFFRQYYQTTKYHTLAVFGGQGSGKSTLLNKLFGTSFATMREDGGRSQTTRGAFASLIRDTENSSSEKWNEQEPLLLIVDFEGTDGMERGEDQTFERKLALFAVACADVVVINMFANEVGRFNAANLALLRTVFEINLNVFQKAKANQEKSKKNTLFFVIRDFVSGTLDGNSKVMTDALSNIWDKVAKPEEFKTSKIDDLFHLKFACLPHYVLQRDRFDLEVSLLKDAFLLNNDAEAEIAGQLEGSGSDNLATSASTGQILNANTQYVFKDDEHCGTGIPIYDNVTYLANIWDTVKNQKDLDIPSQRLLVAQLRSQEVSEELLAKFKKNIDDIQQELDAGIVRRGISKHLSSLQRKASLEFKERMHLYLETSPAVGRALDALERMMKRKSREVFRKFALCLAKALLRSNDTAVSLLVTRAIDNMIPQLTETWLDDVDHAVNSSSNSGNWNAFAASNATTPYTPSSPAGAATSLESPQLSAASRAVDPRDKPSATPLSLDPNSSNISAFDNAADNEANEEDAVGLSRAFSGVLSDVRKMNDVKKNLARVDVSRYVSKFWGYIMKEIDAMVADLKIAVKKVQRETLVGNNNNAAAENNDAGIDPTDGTRAQGVILLAQQQNSSSTSDAMESSDSLLKEIGQAFADDDAAVDLVFTNVASGFEERVRERVRNMTSDCSNTLRSYFERHLFHSDHGAGATRHFTTKKALEDAYRKAHTGGLLLLAALTVFRGRYYLAIDLSSSSSYDNNQQKHFMEVREDSPMTFHSNNNDDNNNTNHNRSASPSQTQQVHQEIFLVHFTKAMDAFHVKYNLDQEQIAASRRVLRDDGNHNNTTDNNNGRNESSSNSTSSSSSSSSSPSATNSIVKSFEFPNLPVTSSADDAVIATVDPGVKAIHEFNERFVMLSKAAFRHAFDMFQQSCSFTYQLQLRQLERDAVSGAPTWMIFVLVFFVAREVMYIFADPVLLIICIIVAYFFFKEWIRGQYLKFIETGPPAVTVPLKIGVDKALDVIQNAIGGNETNKAKKD